VVTVTAWVLTFLYVALAGYDLSLTIQGRPWTASEVWQVTIRVRAGMVGAAVLTCAYRLQRPDPVPKLCAALLVGITVGHAYAAWQARPPRPPRRRRVPVRARAVTR
jgi:hypothetical protein